MPVLLVTSIISLVLSGAVLMFILYDRAQNDPPFAVPLSLLASPHKHDEKDSEWVKDNYF